MFHGFLLNLLFVRFIDFTFPSFPGINPAVMNGSRLVTVLISSLADYLPFGRSCCWTVYGVVDLVVGTARWMMLLSRPFDSDGFVLCLLVSVPMVFHFLLFFYALLCRASAGVL